MPALSVNRQLPVHTGYRHLFLESLHIGHGCIRVEPPRDHQRSGPDHTRLGRNLRAQQAMQADHCLYVGSTACQLEHTLATKAKTERAEMADIRLRLSFQNVETRQHTSAQ